MEGLGEIIKNFRKRKRLSQSEFAILIGADSQSVSNYETGKVKSPNNEILRKIAKVIGFDIEEYESALRNATPHRKLARIPLYELAMPASHWAELVDADEATNETGNCQTIDQGLLRVRIHGDCMEPKWHSGEIVELEIWRHDSPFPVGRDVAITDSNHMTTFKRLVGMDDSGDEIILEALNQEKYPGEIRLPKSMLARMAIAVGTFSPRN